MPPVTRSTTRLAKVFQTQVEATTAPEPAPSFPQFNRLPLEVRMLIWEAAMEPRIVHLQIRPLRECHHILRHVRSDVAVPDLCGSLAPLDVRIHTCSDFPQFNKLGEDIRGRRGREFPLLGFKSDCPIPPVLLACRESFGIASKSYTRSFSSLGSLPQTYFNFALDTLYLDSALAFGVEPMLRDKFLPDEVAKVERLAVHHRISKEIDEMMQGQALFNVLLFFGNVRDLTIVHEDYTEPIQRGDGMKDMPRLLTFVEPVHMYIRAFMFWNPEYHVNHEPEHQNLPRKKVYLRSLDLFFDYWVNQFVINQGGSFIRPVIDDKVLTTPKLKARFDALQQAYEAVSSCRCYESEIFFHN